MANPKFYELQRLRKSTWDTPRFIRGYDLTLDDRLVLPRGLRHTVAAIVERAGSRLAVTDVRNPGREIDVAVHRRTRHQSRAPRSARCSPMTTASSSPRRVRQDRHGLRGDRRTRHLDPGARRPQGPGRPVAHPDRAVPRHQARPARRRPAQAHRRRGHRACCPPWPGATTSPNSPSGYGHVIVDECHHLAAAAYDHSVKRIAAQFWLGLTATPTRRDGLGELVTWQLGPVRHTA